MTDTADDGREAFKLPITTPGTVQTRLTGLSGELGLNIVKF